MAYTPELSQIGSATLRRHACHLQKPMTTSLELLIGMTATKMAQMRPGKVSRRCQDNSICEDCPFLTRVLVAGQGFRRDTGTKDENRPGHERATQKPKYNTAQ
jgi:hypothetical protein